MMAGDFLQAWCKPNNCCNYNKTDVAEPAGILFGLAFITCERELYSQEKDLF